MNDHTIHSCFLSNDQGLGEVIARALGSGFETRTVSPSKADAFNDMWGWSHIALLDLRATTTSSPLIDRIHALGVCQPIIVLCDAENRQILLSAMEQGAYDSITNPPDIAELRLILKRAWKFREAQEELKQLRSNARNAGRLHELVGASNSMHELFALAKKIAPCDVNVLITGETGTGKELLARAIHQMSSRVSQPLVAFSCANLPETLVEDELFGHEKGAFTGALTARRGRLETADHGTLFLDEIGDLGIGLQPKLLRVLQERRFERLGSNNTINVNIRLISATHQNLTEMAQQGKFREDLYYRLNVVQMHLPPLRERHDDITLLAQHFLQISAQQFNKKVTRFSQSALHALEEYAWPGNVRELENAVQRAVVFSEGQTVDLHHFPSTIRSRAEEATPTRSYEEEVRQFKRRLLIRTLRECGWRKAESARTLGVARGYLHRLINQMDIRQIENENAPANHQRFPPVKRVM
ncbi:MAG: sigma 54-interacting transcriptional regulator [Candidatus Acidiferrales bacterium]